jgi:hypothetical protein
MLPMLAVLAAQQHLRQRKCPLLIRHIARITLPINSRHPFMLRTNSSPAKNLARFKLHDKL